MKPHDLPHLFSFPREPALVTLTLRITTEANKAAAGYAKGMRTTKTHWLEMLIEDTIKYYQELGNSGEEKERASREDLVSSRGVGSDTIGSLGYGPDMSVFREDGDA